MQKVIRIGVLTPSSNTALEPLTNAILRELPNVHAHFARFRVTNISLTDQRLGSLMTAISWRQLRCWPTLNPM